MSQNEVRTKGPGKGPSTTKFDSSKKQLNAKTNHTNTLSTNNNIANNSNKHSATANSHLDENHNTKHIVEKDFQQTATPEQIRMAQLLSTKSSEDPEILKKIKQVAEVVTTRKQDDIAIALHECDYDVARTIEFLLEGGDLTQDWVTAGIKGSKSKQTTGADDEPYTNGNSNSSSHNNNKSSGKQKSSSTSAKSNGDGVKSRAKSSGQSQRPNNNGKPKRSGDKLADGLEENMMQLDVRDPTEGGKSSGEFYDQNNGDYSNNRGKRNTSFNGTGKPARAAPNGARSGPPNRPARNGNNEGGQGFKNFGLRNNNKSGDEGKLDNDTKGESNTTNSYDHVKEEKTAPVLLASNVIAGDQLSFRNKLTNGLLTAQSVPTSAVGAVGTVGPTSGTTRNDNMRDIGTWSNEQISSDKKQFAAGNRKNLGPNQGNKKDEWDNEEEWQGDLSQTQIFTASAQKKEELNPNDPNARAFDSNFPIGHFNAEEATQKIKKAVGIGSNVNTTINTAISKPTTTTAAVASSTAPASSTSKPADASSNKLLNDQTNQQRAQQSNKVNKIPTVKPPPPSTKIPKSAVVMPDGSNSTSISLDVQFGCDFDNPIPEKKVPANDISKQAPSLSSVPTPVVQPAQQPQQKPSSLPTNQSTVQQQNLINNNKPSAQPQQQPPQQQQVSAPAKPIQQPNAFNNDKLQTQSTTSAIGNQLGQSNSHQSASANLAKLMNSDASIVNVVNNQANNNSNTASQLGSNSIASLHNNNNQTQHHHHHQQQQQQQQHHHILDNSNKLSQQNNFNDSSKVKSQNNSIGQQYNNQQQQFHNLSSNLHSSSQQQLKNQLINLNHGDTNLLHQSQQQQHQNNSNNLNNHHYQQQQQHHHSMANNALNKDANVVGTNTKQNNSQQQLLNISPPNNANTLSVNSQASNSNSNIKQSAQQQSIQQLQQQMSQSNAGNNSQQQLNAGLNANQLGNNTKQQQNTTTLPPPPPGVNLVNPSNQFLMGLPFQNFPYFEHSQMDGNNIMNQMYHLAGLPPPGVGANANAAGAGVPSYGPISDAKFNRTNDATTNSSQLNATIAAAAAQLTQQQQQQQAINLIPPNLNANYPFFFPNYYPNMFMSMPNGPQGNPPFSNKPPYGAFNNNAGDYDQGKDYNSYNQQGPIKSSGSNLGNVSELGNVGGYQKNVDKSNTGYHTPPPNYSNSLINQPHPNQGNAPPNQYPYMMGAPNNNPHSGLQQDNMNSRGVSQAIGSMKSSIPKQNYPQTSWN